MSRIVLAIAVATALAAGPAFAQPIPRVQVDPSIVLGADPAAAASAWRATRWTGYEKTGDFYFGVAKPLSHDWKASYGVLLQGDSGGPARGWSAARVDFLAVDEALRKRRDPENWRHFLGLEYTGVENFTFLGGVAKSGVNRGGGPVPTGYEGLRLNAGARWRGKAWGLESHFAWIPGGASRLPADAFFFPNQSGDSGSAYLASITLSLRF